MLNHAPFCPDSFLVTFLNGPVQDFLARPKKAFRGDLVNIGFELYACEDHNDLIAQNLKDLSEMLEWIHAGSLIVDDIQDDSEERRGEQSLHRIYGMPCALNAANWMYFEALKKVHELSVSDRCKLKILSLTHQAMALAHQGQAFDLMAHMLHVPRENIFDLGMKSHELKSGVLIALALQVGALLADENADLKNLEELGKAIGSSLQRFDDLGNIKLGSTHPKALEDLRLGRPSWMWMYLSRNVSLEDFNLFKDSVLSLPHEEKLANFLKESGARELALEEARRLHQEISLLFKTNYPGRNSPEAIVNLKYILEKVAHAYT